MTDIVQLDELTINQIAAGEVIERPASVVKELVDNSIDAGAKNITIEIKDGGISLIRVTDDGEGIKKEDVEIAFERHATSKIRSAKDLEEVATMGFRGEALASIAAVSKVEMVTKTKDQVSGVRVVVEAGDVLEVEPAGTSTGTVMTIKNLFFNTPVRYKFLKKDYTETGYIEEIVRKMALVNNNIAFKLISNSKVILQTAGKGDFKSVIYSIFGEEIANAVVDAKYKSENIEIEGVVGKPEIARSNRRNQIFYVNGRPIKDKTLTAATDKALKGLVPGGRFGFCVLNLKMSQSLIDVNVHPTKEEIRFKDEKEAFSSVYNAISNALSKTELVENLFVPKYDGDDNKAQLKEDEAEYQHENEKKEKRSFFNFKEKQKRKQEREKAKNFEEELLEKNNQIYEAIVNNPHFSYKEILKQQQEEREAEEQEQKEEDERIEKLKNKLLERLNEKNDENVEILEDEQMLETKGVSSLGLESELRERISFEDKGVEEIIEGEIELDKEKTEETETKEEELINQKTQKIDDIQKKIEQTAILNVKEILAKYKQSKSMDNPKVETTDAVLDADEKVNVDTDKKYDFKTEEEVEVIEGEVNLDPENKSGEDFKAQDSNKRILDKILKQRKEDLENTGILDFKEVESLERKVSENPVQRDSMSESSELEQKQLKDKVELLTKMNNDFEFKEPEVFKDEYDIKDLNLVDTKDMESELKTEGENLSTIEQKGKKINEAFSKMYKKAFGVETVEEQQKKEKLEKQMSLLGDFSEPEQTMFEDDGIPLYKIIGVAFKTYIIIEMDNSIYMIDQHAAHERLLYEEVKRNFYNSETRDSETLLLPDVITLSYREMELIRENADIFNKAGFEFEEFGINTIKLVAVPRMTEILNTKQLFLDILDEIDLNYITGKDEIIDRFLATIACKAAVKANMELSDREIKALLDDLLRIRNPFTCPHGRPTAVKMSKYDLERKFARK